MSVSEVDVYLYRAIKIAKSVAGWLDGAQVILAPDRQKPRFFNFLVQGIIPVSQLGSDVALLQIAKP